MARFNVNDADNYGGQGGGGFFSLKNDKDVARVRFLYNGIADVEGDSVHEIERNGKKRYVNCLRGYGDPVDVCPFCKAGKFVQVKYFVPLYNLDTETYQTWERGKKFGAKLTSICSHYPNTVSHIFEIERNGKAGDTQTTYEIFETGTTPEVTLESFDVPNPLGTIILDKTAEEMETFLDTGDFGDDAPQSEASAPQRRPVGNAPQANNGGSFTRRTPAGGDGNRRQAF